MDSIYYYYRNDTYSGWHYFVADYEDHTLNVFDPSFGFWIKLKGDLNLTLRAPKIYTATQRIYSGWNLIGYPWDIKPISNAFGSELSYLDIIFIHNSPLWHSWKMGKTMNNIEAVEPGFGIWINSSSVRNWTIDNGLIS